MVTNIHQVGFAVEVMRVFDNLILLQVNFTHIFDQFHLRKKHISYFLI